MISVAYFLGVARAEFARRWWMILRYPVDYLSGVAILYFLFVGIFYGVKTNVAADAPGMDATLDGLVLGTAMWFFTISTFNQYRVVLEMEAVTGTLEQLFLSPVRFVYLLFTRSIVGFFYSVVAVSMLLVLIMATTGRWLEIDIAPVLLVMVLAMIGVAGIALMLGGLSLIFKRLGQLNTIVQFGFIFLAYPPIEKLSPAMQTFAYSLPLARGMTLLRGMVIEGWALTDPVALANLASLALNSAVYLVLGTAAYLLSERIAKEHGLLGHY